MAESLLNFLPVIAQDVDSVRARYDSDANAGRAPTDPDWQDTTPGGFYWDHTQGSVMEAVRLWDFVGTEMVAAMFPATAWGDYLDLHAETVGLERGDEVQATGAVRFAGPVGTLIPQGTQVAVLQADPSDTDDPASFTTDESIVLAAEPGPTNLAAVPSGVGGSLPAGLHYYRVTAIVGGVETVASNEISSVTSGSTSQVALSWSAAAGATAYKIYRGSATGGEVLLDSPVGTGTAYSDTGALAPSTTRVPTNTVGITAIEAGSAGNVGTGTITQVLSPVNGSPTVVNDEPTSGGSDVESDDRLRQRILAEYKRSGGGGNKSDYVKWVLDEIPQVGFVTVEPVWAGPGTVRIIITDQDNNPNSASVVQATQDFLDPVPGEGAGRAPVGPVVSVVTPTLLPVDWAAVPVFQPGYSLDGGSGTIATRADIIESVESYLGSLPPGGEAVLNKVISQIMLVPGLEDVGSVELNGSPANVVPTALEVVTPGTPTLT